ncbi:MAG: hypothetical protein GXP43_01415 [bacterium]|nr:hypothetical protein [bacterium]
MTVPVDAKGGVAMPMPDRGRGRISYQDVQRQEWEWEISPWEALRQGLLAVASKIHPEIPQETLEEWLDNQLQTIRLTGDNRFNNPTYSRIIRSWEVDQSPEEGQQSPPEGGVDAALRVIMNSRSYAQAFRTMKNIFTDPDNNDPQYQEELGKIQQVTIPLMVRKYVVGRLWEGIKSKLRPGLKIILEGDDVTIPLDLARLGRACQIVLPAMNKIAVKLAEEYGIEKQRFNIIKALAYLPFSQLEERERNQISKIRKEAFRALARDDLDEVRKLLKKVAIKHPKAVNRWLAAVLTEEDIDSVTRASFLLQVKVWMQEAQAAAAMKKQETLNRRLVSVQRTIAATRRRLSESNRPEAREAASAYAGRYLVMILGDLNNPKIRVVYVREIKPRNIRVIDQARIEGGEVVWTIKLLPVWSASLHFWDVNGRRKNSNVLAVFLRNIQNTQEALRHLGVEEVGADGTIHIDLIADRASGEIDQDKINELIGKIKRALAEKYGDGQSLKD